MRNQRYLTDEEATNLGLELNKIHGGRTKAQYTIEDEAYQDIVSKRLIPNKRAFVETIKKFGKDGEIMSSTEKLQSEPIEVPEHWEAIKISTSKTTGQQWVQYAPKAKEIEEEINFDFVEGIVKKHIKPVNNKPPKEKETSKFDRLIITDVHIGMTTNKDGFALYGQKWDEVELMQRLDYVVEIVTANKQGNELIIDELGDLLDGWDGKTTRKGHDLPQNMDNQKAFDVAVNFKIKLIDLLVNEYQEITINNICEDNHAGAFGYVVNSAIKSILEIKYKSVKVVNHRRFINHYYKKAHCFVLSHGKDSKNLKFGFKPVLDSKQVEKIDQYCKHHHIYRNSEFVEFSKGDSHQMIFDMATSDDFDYCNYPAFSPSSEWVQTNFKKGRSGFVFGSIEYEKNIKTMTPYWFNI
mgnify:CR=1 FL=1|tara:strand:+ start:1164 stop:2393 length:1230 start_codon:yes stop_codon:yes gene_type:complete